MITQRTGSFSIANVAFGACCAPSSWELEAIAAWSVLNCGSVFIRERDSCGALCVCVCVCSLWIWGWGDYFARVPVVWEILWRRHLFFFCFLSRLERDWKYKQEKKKKGTKRIPAVWGVGRADPDFLLLFGLRRIRMDLLILCFIVIAIMSILLFLFGSWKSRRLNSNFIQGLAFFFPRFLSRSISWKRSIPVDRI